MSNQDIKIAAIVVSFNRKALLVECLDALLKQTRTLDKIILIDNASTDGTLELLEERELLSNPLIDCVVLDKNVGGAGGFTAGIRRALDHGYDWFWLMDDDAEPEPDNVEKCHATLARKDAVLVAPVLGFADGEPDYSGMHRSRLLSPAEASVRSLGRPITAAEAADAPIVEFDACSFVGPFIAARAVRAVGLPREEFFIHYDDLEYTLRLGKIGKLLLVTNAVIRHKQAQLTGRKFSRKTIFGDRERVRFDKLWLTYYGYRNLTWLVSRKIVPTRLSKLLVWHARLIIGVILYDDNKLSRLHFWSSAFLDGLAGRFDNDKPRRWMQRKT